MTAELNEEQNGSVIVKIRFKSNWLKIEDCKTECMMTLLIQV